MAETSFEELLELVDQLSTEQQIQLTTHLLEAAKRRELTVDEKMKLLRAAQVDVQVINEPSIRREDWYGDDGR